MGMNMMNQAAILGEPHLLWSSATERPAPPVTATFDFQLARQIAAGDMAAFEQLYQRYHRRIYTLCLRMTNNVAEAEDLTQEVFLHVYHKIGSFRGEASMMTWLHRVTVNQVLMHFRKNAARREQTTEDGELPEPVIAGAKSPGPMPMVDHLALDRAIAQLAPGYRAVFILHDVEGYDHTEIAQMQGIAVGTSKSQLHKARMRLRELLKRECQPPEGNPIEAP